MNSILIENPSENNKNFPPTKESDSILLDGVSHSQFQPVFTQFLKGTELIGRVSETLMKKFGDTYVDPGLNKSSDKSAIYQSQEKFGLKNQIKSDRQVKSERGNPNPVEEKSTPEKPINRPKQTFQNEQKVTSHRKSLPNSAIDFKSPNIQIFKPSTLSQSTSSAIQKVTKTHLVTKIAQIIHGKFSSNGTKSATYKIDGGYLGKLELKLTQKHSMTKATVVVESDTIKPIIEKIITGVKENLNEKGMRFESFNVEVGPDKRDFSEGKRFSKNLFYDVEDDEISNSDQIILRQFGYNTIEVIA